MGGERIRFKKQRVLMLSVLEIACVSCDVQGMKAVPKQLRETKDIEENESEERYPSQQQLHYDCPSAKMLRPVVPEVVCQEATPTPLSHCIGSSHETGYGNFNLQLSRLSPPVCVFPSKGRFKEVEASNSGLLSTPDSLGIVN